MNTDLVTQLAAALQAAQAGQGTLSGRSIEEDADARYGSVNVTVPWFREQSFTHFPATITGMAYREGHDDKNQPYGYHALLLRTSRGTDVSVRLMQENYDFVRRHFGALREGRYIGREVVVWFNPAIMMGRDKVGGVRLCLPGETPWQQPRPSAPPSGFHEPLQETRQIEGAANGPANSSRELNDDIPF